MTENKTVETSEQGKYIFCGVNDMCANCKKLTEGLGYDPDCPKCQSMGAKTRR